MQAFKKECNSSSAFTWEEVNYWSLQHESTQESLLRTKHFHVHPHLPLPNLHQRAEGRAEKHMFPPYDLITAWAQGRCSKKLMVVLNGKQHHPNLWHKPISTEYTQGDCTGCPRLSLPFNMWMYSPTAKSCIPESLVQSLIHHQCCSLKGQARFLNQTSFSIHFPLSSGNSLHCAIKQSSCKAAAQDDTWRDKIYAA